MKYEYDSTKEVFKRVDGNGRYLKFNIEEARRIKSLRDMGTPISTIYRKIKWSNDISETQLRTFVENIEKGNIPLNGDYPVPVKKVKTDDDRIYELEKRVLNLENELNALAASKNKQIENNVTGKVKSWLKF